MVPNIHRMTSLIQKVARAAFQTFSQMNDISFPDNLAKLQESAKNLTAADVNFTLDFPKNSEPNQPELFVAPASYIGICKNSDFSMGIFALNGGAKIPLHDHPGMYGVLKVICGKLLIKSFNLKQNSVAEIGECNLQRIPVTKNDDVIVSQLDDACVLTPTKGNFHEVHALDGPAAFIDILGPPYSQSRNRDCHYYRVLTKDSGLWLEELETPPVEFWTDCGVYKGPQINDVFNTKK